MLKVILCVFIAAAFVAGHKQDVTFLGLNTGEMSDRELIELLVKSVTNIETERLKQQERIKVLEDTVGKQNELITGLQIALRMQHLDESETQGLANVSKQRETYATNTEPVEHKRLVKQRDTILRLSGVARRQLQIPGTPVAFSALVSVHDLPHLGSHQNLVFDVTNVNIDNVYNTNHGIFTVPVSGVYVITSTVLAFNNREVWCDITVNGVANARIYARGTDGRHDQGSQTILLHLNQGDDVTIQNEATDDTVYGQLYTSFSGFLLYEDEPSSIVG